MTQPQQNLRQAAQGSVPPKVRKVLQQAAAVGWHATPRNKRGFWAVAPDEETRAYVPITIKDEDRTAKTIESILQKWKKAQMEQAKVIQGLALGVEKAPLYGCGICGRSFETEAAARECVSIHTQDKAPDPAVIEAAEGAVDNNMSTDSGTISSAENEESDTPVPEKKPAPNAGVPHASHRKWQQVDAGLARDLYQAMKSRTQGSMTPSAYANIIAKDIEETWTERGHVSYQDPMTLLNMVQGLVSQVESADKADSEEVEALNQRVWDLTEELAAEKKRADEAEATLQAAAELFTPKK